MKIKVERSGGFAAIPSSNEVNAEDLSPVLKGTVRKLFLSSEPAKLGDTTPKGAADYVSYKITLQNRDKSRVIECNQFDMSKDLKSLIEYVEKKSEKKR